MCVVLIWVCCFVCKIGGGLGVVCVVYCLVGGWCMVHARGAREKNMEMEEGEVLVSSYF